MNLKKYHIIGFIFTVILGSLLHFAYSFFGENKILGYFSAVNESTWEHLKLIIVPIVIFSIFEYFIYGKNLEGFILIKALSILIGMAVIVIAFYTYMGIIGDNYLIFDISTFILGVFIAYYFSYNKLKSNLLYARQSNYIGLFIIFLLIFSIIYFTIKPPKINLFLDPVKNNYGR